MAFSLLKIKSTLIGVRKSSDVKLNVVNCVTGNIPAYDLTKNAALMINEGDHMRYQARGFPSIFSLKSCISGIQFHCLT